MVTWVHANGGIMNGGVACACAKWRVFAHFCAFLCVSSVRYVLPKWAAKKREVAQNSAKHAKNVFYAISCLVIPPFARHRVTYNDPSVMQPNAQEKQLKC